MYKIDNDTVSTSLPASTSEGTAGYFTDGNAATGLAATVLPAEFMNMIMMEIANVVTTAGLTLDKSNFTQLTLAIKAMIADLSTVAWDNITDIPDTLTLSGAATLENTLSVTGGATFKTNVSVGGIQTIGGAIEIGAQSGASTPYIDFHSGATFADYDARIIATGGTGSSGGGVLTADVSIFDVAGALQVSGNIMASGVGSFVSSGQEETLTLTDTGTNGANLKLAGSGDTTPNKYLRAVGGGFQIVNSAYTAAIFTVDDVGNLTTTGTFYGAGAAIFATTVQVDSTLTAIGEIRSTSANSYRSTFGDYGTFWRNDGVNLYLMITDSGDVDGGWGTLRPFTVTLSSGLVAVENGLSVSGGFSSDANLSVGAATYQTDGNIQGTTWGGAFSTYLSTYYLQISNLGTALAARTYDAVGQYAFMYYPSVATPNTLIAGSSLLYASGDSDTSSDFDSSITPPGTWRAQGYAGGSGRDRITLFQRVA